MGIAYYKGQGWRRKSTRFGKRRSGKGFTLVELMIVLAIIGVAAAIGIPNWVAGKPLRELKGAARQIFGEFMRVKSMAVANSKAYRVLFDLEDKSVRVFHGEDGCFRAAFCGSWTEVQSPPARLPSSISVVGTPFGDFIASFNVDGTAEAGNITLENSKGQRYKVVVSSAGRVRMEKVR